MNAIDATQPSAELDEQLISATIGALELFGVYLGTRLGLYDALRHHGPLTASGLAAAAGVDARYAREWLEQQAVAGILEVDDPSRPSEDRRFTLPPGHAAVVTDPDDPSHVAPFAEMVIGIAGAIEEVVDAYRSGAGVPYRRYGRAFRHGQGLINRPAFVNDLAATWLPAAGLHESLSRAGARIADLGCGHGWSTIALAQTYPDATVIGLDADAPSIEEAAQHARERGVDVAFHVSDAGSVAEHGPFDVILLLEVLHDLAHPVEALAACRAALQPGGSVLVADEAVAETLTAPGDEIERMMYGWSISHCLPASRAEPDSSAIGTAIRPDTVRSLAAAAGLTAEVVDVDAGFFRLYRLEP